MASTGSSTDPLGLHTDEIAKAATGDPGRLASLYARVAPSVVAWASLKLTPSLRRVIEVEDVVQEVWCRVLDSLAAFDPGRASFRSWVFGIANHVVLKAYRRLGRDVPSATEALTAVQDDVTSITQRIVRDETLKRCIARIAALDEDDRNLVIHCGLEGSSAAEAGRVLGLSADAVAKRWQRLRARLRDASPFRDLLAP